MLRTRDDIIAHLKRIEADDTVPHDVRLDARYALRDVEDPLEQLYMSAFRRAALSSVVPLDIDEKPGILDERKR